jgi:hypothetical protein
MECQLAPLQPTRQIQRVHMSKRLGLPELTDTTPDLDRLFEADCPPKGAPVQQPIPCRKVDLFRNLNSAAVLLTGMGGRFADAAATLHNDKVCECWFSGFIGLKQRKKEK